MRLSFAGWVAVGIAAVWMAPLACSAGSTDTPSIRPGAGGSKTDGGGGKAGSTAGGGGSSGDSGVSDTSIETGGCSEGAQRCSAGKHQVCKGGVYSDDPCASGKVCNETTGACMDCQCTPGQTGDCADTTHIQSCNADCLGYSPKACGTMKLCKAGACIDQLCIPGETSCSDATTWQTCNAEGTGFDPGGTCAEKEVCQGSGCQSLCALADAQPSSVGCSFFALNMDNFNESNPDAVVVGNTSTTLTAVVSLFGSPNGVETPVEANVPIPPLGQHTFTIPNAASDVIESVSMLRKGGAYRIQSDIPVIAYQHSPLQPQATNDASCLIPESTLGMRYVIGSYNDALGEYPSYFNVVASVDNTSVTFVVPVATEGGSGVPAVAAGGTATVVMNRFDTLQVVAKGSDITGTELTATAPVAVFGAVECAQVPPGYTFCDHLEEQSIPTRNWGKKYVGAHVPKRSGSERFYWRVLAQDNGTTITTDPVQTGFPKTLAKGEFYEFWTQESFLFDGDKPFAAFQYVSGQDAFGAGTGDPAMITAIPVEQFLKSYVVLTPSGYSHDYLQIVRTSDADVIVDGAPVPASEYYALGSYTVADHKVAAGPHVLTSTNPFGIVGVGYTGVTSYGYPGGFALKDLTTQ